MAKNTFIKIAIHNKFKKMYLFKNTKMKEKYIFTFCRYSGTYHRKCRNVKRKKNNPKIIDFKQKILLNI